MVRVPVNKHHSERGQIVPGDVIWVENLSMGNGQFKSRPVVIVKVEGGEAVYYQCTSQSSAVRRRYEIMDISSSGLDHDSFVDLEPKRLPISRLGRRLGHLGDYDLEGLNIK